MTNVKRKAGKLIAVLIAVFAALVTCIFAMTPQNVLAYADTYNYEVGYKRHIPTLDDDFADNKVIVTLKPTYSDVNKSINLQRFSTSNVLTAQQADLESFKKRISDSSLETDFSDKIIIESVDDLTYMANPSAIINRTSFTQILSI